MRRLPTRLLTVLILLGLLVSMAPGRADTPSAPALGDQWDPRGTGFDSGERVEEPQALRFAHFWTALFAGAQLDTPELQATADAMGLHLDAGTDHEHLTGAGPLGFYIDSETVTDEAFGPYTVGQKKYLIVYLINHWRNYVPGFAATMATAAGTPDVMDTIELAEMLSLVIWDKNAFKQKLSAPFGGDQGGVPAPAGVPTAPTTEDDELVATLDKQRIERLTAAPIELPEVPVLPGLDLVQLPEPPTVSDAQAIANAALEDVRDLTAHPPTVADVQELVDSLTYIPCVRTVGRAERCLFPIPVGTPSLPMDVDGNGIPDATVLLALDPLTVPGGLKAILAVTRLGTSAVKGEVFVKYNVPEAEARMTAGFDGLAASTTPLIQTASVALESFLAAKEGDVRVAAALGHNLSTPITSTFIGGFAPLSTEAESTPAAPIKAKVKFESAPRNFTAKLRLVDTPDDERVEVTVGSGGQPTVTADVVQSDDSGTRVSHAVVQKIPSSVNVVVDLAGVDSPSVVYTATSTLPRVEVSHVEHDASKKVVKSMGATVTGVPARWSLKASPAGPAQLVYTASSVLTSITGTYFDAVRSLSLGGKLDGLPAGTATLDLDVPSGRVAYTADGNISGVDIDARVGAWVGDLTLTGIPRTWSVGFGDGGATFDAGGIGIGSVVASVSNHGGFSRPVGNHASVNVRERLVDGKAVRDVDAGFRMTGVRKVSIAPSSTGTAVDLRMGSGLPFTAHAGIDLLDNRAGRFDATLNPMPSSIQATFGETTTITTNANTELRAYADFGDKAALAAAGPVPLVHGLAVRDGASSSGKAVKAQMWLTGLPTSASFGPGAFSFSNFRPTQPTLTVDAALDDVLAEPTSGRIVLSAVPDLLNLSFTTASKALEPCGSELTARLVTNKPMGSLQADVSSGTTGGRLTVSSIPSNITATFTELEGQTKVNWASQPIAHVGVGFYATKTSTGDAPAEPAEPAEQESSCGTPAPESGTTPDSPATPSTVKLRGSVDLREIPGNITLTAGRDAGGGGPVLTYSASANTLDVDVIADGSLRKGSSSLDANLHFVLQNLGRTVSVSAEGGKLRLVSTDPITTIFAKVSASYRYDKDGEGVLNEGSWLEFPYDYRVHLGAAVEDLVVRLTNATSFVLEPGIASKITGNFGSFRFAWGEIPITFDLFGRLRVRVDWPSPFGSSTFTVAKAGLSGSFTIGVDWHTYSGAKGPWFGFNASAAWCDITLGTTLQPDPLTIGRNELLVTGPRTTPLYVIPNPWGVLPSALVDLVAFATISPRSFGVTWDVDC